MAWSSPLPHHAPPHSGNKVNTRDYISDVSASLRWSSLIAGGPGGESDAGGHVSDDSAITDVVIAGGPGFTDVVTDDMVIADRLITDIRWSRRRS
jgi:hypothetical protein